MNEQDEKSGFAAEQISQWARYVVLALIGVGVAGLIALGVVSMSENKRAEKARKNWDHIYKALKDKSKPDEVMAAFEKVAPEVVGSPTHAFVLMQLGDMHFKEGISPTKNPEDRAASLKKAQALFETVATKEPYSSNPAFGPVAVEGLSLSLEQAKDYDKAISLLEDNLKKWESHFLYSKLTAQLGRLYWLRSETKDKPEDKEKDREAARQKLGEVLRQGSANSQGAWRDQAEYVKSLVDKPGKALPDGKAPPVKAAAAATPAGAGAAPATPGTATTPAVPAKTDAKIELKKDEKTEEKKKTGNLEQKQDNETAAGSSSGHLSFAQIQKALKEGRTAFCGCVRCGPDESQAVARQFE